MLLFCVITMHNYGYNWNHKACIAAGLVTQDPDRELYIVQLSILGMQADLYSSLLCRPLER